MIELILILLAILFGNYSLAILLVFLAHILGDRWYDRSIFNIAWYIFSPNFSC